MDYAWSAESDHCRKNYLHMGVFFSYTCNIHTLMNHQRKQLIVQEPNEFDTPF